MPIIKLHTWIKAPVLKVFDLSRSVDLHQLSTAKTNETIVAGRKTGLMELNETVTWRAKHLGVYQKLSTRITAFDAPHFFVDEMVKGAFHSFRHEHRFESVNDGTKMIDVFTFKSPFGVLGKVADNLFLLNYMKQFLIERNETIKRVAENSEESDTNTV